MLWCFLSSLLLPDSSANLSWPWLVGNSSSMGHHYRGVGWMSRADFPSCPSEMGDYCFPVSRVTCKPIRTAPNLQEHFSKDVKNLLALCSWQYFTQNTCDPELWPRCFRATWICVTLLSAVPVPSNLSSFSSVANPSGTRTSCAAALLKQHLLWDSPFPPAFDFKSCEISSHCPVAQSWIVFPLISLASWHRSCWHPWGSTLNTGWFLSIFFCTAFCICFCDTDHCRISLCSSDKQIQSLQRSNPGICAVPLLW